MQQSLQLFYFYILFKNKSNSIELKNKNYLFDQTVDIYPSPTTDYLLTDNTDCFSYDSEIILVGNEAFGNAMLSTAQYETKWMIAFSNRIHLSQFACRPHCHST